MTAEAVKGALRRRHPGDTYGSMPGQWTCIEEWLGIDLLALNAWQKGDVVGYEVKVSRSDMRRELLRPHKRAKAIRCTTEFYFAVPAGLYTNDELKFEEPEWEREDFQRQVCLAGCSKRRGQRGSWRRVPVPAVVRSPYDLIWDGWTDVPCDVCDGRGHTEASRVERDAPTLWVPADVGLVVVHDTTTRVVKRSPKRKDPEPIASSRQRLNDLVRWVSHRPDPRHATAPQTEQQAAA